jgi:hypothetical protein
LTIPCSAPRSAALSAPVAAPLPPRALTTLSSMGRIICPGRGRSAPKIVAVKAPRALAAASAAALAAASSGVSPWRAGAVSPLKMRGEVTIAAAFGLASGTLMTSMRKSAEFGFWSGAWRTQPGSSLGERTLAEPETYTYTFAASRGSASTVCVCEPRHVWTFATYFGSRTSLMSKMRTPRRRSALTVSRTPPAPQSRRPSFPSPETKRRFLYTLTSLCDAGQ